MTYSEWLDQIETESIEKIGVRHTQTFAALGEKQHPTATMPVAATRQPGIRNLPFSYDGFRLICERFQVHESVTKAITRNNTPSFSFEQVNMGDIACGMQTSSPRVTTQSC
jgi:hypothetical protein